MTDRTTRPDVTGIVLAGGRASRFGGPKLDAQVGGTPLLLLAMRAVAEVADVLLVAGPALPPMPGFGGVDVRLVPDAEPFGGPLVAIEGALHHARGTLAIVVGGDMPRLVPAVLRAMLDSLASDNRLDAITLEPATVDTDDPRRIATLPLAFRVAPVRAVIADALASGDRSIVRLLGRLRSTEFPATEWLALDPGGRTLLDVDRVADIDRVDRSDFR